MTTFHLDIPCLQKYFSTKVLLQENDENVLQIMGRYPELASKFNKSPSSMISDSVPMAQLYHSFPQLMK